jgi:hypothetical protein
MKHEEFLPLYSYKPTKTIGNCDCDFYLFPSCISHPDNSPELHFSIYIYYCPEYLFLTDIKLCNVEIKYAMIIKARELQYLR